MLTRKQTRLDEDRRRNVARVVSGILDATTAEPIRSDLDVIGCHPLSNLIYRMAVREGATGRTKILATASILVSRLSRDAERIQKAQIFAMQSPLVLPARETRNLELIPEGVDETEIEERLTRLHSEVSSVLPMWWKEFAAIGRSYTQVNLNGRSAPLWFSGTFSDAAGAIHGPRIEDPAQYVETLTHESGHLWLNLLSDNSPDFVRNPYSEANYVSPWRNDLRPIHGILHGVYVFSFVAPVLMALGDRASSRRAAELVIEVQDGVRQLEAFGILSEEASEIVDQAIARIDHVCPQIARSVLEWASERYMTSKEDKIRRISEKHPELRFA